MQHPRKTKSRVYPRLGNANRDFPVHCELPRISGLPCVRAVSAEGIRILGGFSGAFVSAGKIPFPGNGDWGSQRLGSSLMGREHPNAGGDQLRGKSHPINFWYGSAETSGTDLADCDGTRFAGPPFWRMPQPVLRSVAFPSEGPSIRE